MEALPQTLIFGILRSGLYALTALGLSISLGVIGIVNFAHGEFVMLGAYVGFWVFLLLSGPLALGPAVSPLVLVLGIPLSAVAMFVLGRGLFRFTLRPLLPRPELDQMLLTFGLGILIQNLVAIVLSPQAQDANLAWRFELLELPVGSLAVTYSRIAAFVVSIVLVGATYVVLARTPMGKQMRAVAQNRLGAMVIGIDVDRVYGIAFGLSLALAAAAGVTLVFQTQVSPFLGLATILKAFSIVVLAGLGNLFAVVWASLLLGLSEQFVSQYVESGGALRDGLFFLIIFFVLLAKPSGLGRSR